MDMSTVISEGQPVLEEMSHLTRGENGRREEKEATGVIISWVAYISATEHITEKAGYYDHTNTLFLDTICVTSEQRFILFAIRRVKRTFQGVKTK